MANGGSTWKRDILLVPIVVGLVIWAAGYFLPKFLEKGKRLSFTIDGPTAYLNSNAVGKATITVGGVETPNIYGYKIRLWNSGGVPLQSLPVRFVFETKVTYFKVFNVTHETVPKQEFGRIDENGSDTFSKRFVYQLLNPTDEDDLTFMTNVDAPLSVYAKAEGLKTELVSAQGRKWTDYSQWLVGLMAAVASFVTLVFQRVTGKDRTDELKRIMIHCPNTDKDVFTGMVVNETSFESSTFERNSVQCPHCGKLHTWSKQDSFLE